LSENTKAWQALSLFGVFLLFLLTVSRKFCELLPTRQDKASTQEKESDQNCVDSYGFSFPYPAVLIALVTGPERGEEPSGGMSSA
jgi:hypothetical protein